jgi:hypothetical protein
MAESIPSVAEVERTLGAGSCGEPRMRTRFFVTLLVLIPIAIDPHRGSWGRPERSRLPLAVLLAPIFALLIVTISFRMY